MSRLAFFIPDRSTFFRLFLLGILFAYYMNKTFDFRYLPWNVFHPEQSHFEANFPATNTFFEGWYYKISSKEFQLAIIPGTYQSTVENYSFILFVTETIAFVYHFPLSAYMSINTNNNSEHCNDCFRIHIGNENTFTQNSVKVHLKPDNIFEMYPIKYNANPFNGYSIQLDIQFENRIDGFPVSLLQLGAMGYYGWIPFLECYHGILSMNSNIYGSIQIGPLVIYNHSSSMSMPKNNNKEIHSEIAHGYIEKDWGTNFPQTWIWIQANQFTKDSNVSVTMSLASVPIMGDSVYTQPGFLSGIWINGELHVFSKYSWARIQHFSITKELKLVENTANANASSSFKNITIIVSDLWNGKRLIVTAIIPNTDSVSESMYPHLPFPTSDGTMRPVLIEWVNATAFVRFEDDANEFIFEDKSFPATVECHSDDHMRYLLSIFGGTAKNHVSL